MEARWACKTGWLLRDIEQPAAGTADNPAVAPHFQSISRIRSLSTSSPTKSLFPLVVLDLEVFKLLAPAVDRLFAYLVLFCNFGNGVAISLAQHCNDLLVAETALPLS